MKTDAYKRHDLFFLKLIRYNIAGLNHNEFFVLNHLVFFIGYNNNQKLIITPFLKIQLVKKTNPISKIYGWSFFTKISKTNLLNKKKEPINDYELFYNYVKRFFKKHNLSENAWNTNVVTQNLKYVIILGVGYEFESIKFDIDTNQPKEQFMDWIKNKSKNQSYLSYCLESKNK